MAVVSTATTTWQGTLFEGKGEVSLATSKAATLPVDWKARAEGSQSVTTPEELLGAAHAACFSMAFSNMLTEAGFAPTELDTSAAVSFVPGEGIKSSALSVTATVPEITEDKFQEIAAEAKAGCPVSQALAGIEITLDAKLA